ncbi:uncharacterized protein DS421_12g366170 [Arachis hypogaea]|nr:uncharacterized protein DS421_12g366170 [Arachis hypogaea]
MEIDNNTSKCVDKSINDNQSCQDLHIKMVDLERLYNNMKGEMAILQAAILDLGDCPAAPEQMSQGHVPSDTVKGKKVLEKDNARVEEDIDIILGGSNPEDTCTPLNGKSQKITIINLDEEMIAQLGNVNYTRTYLREKANGIQSCLELVTQR